MLGYPYHYNDYLFEEEAMERRVDFFDKGLVLFAFCSIWSFLPTVTFASDLSEPPSILYNAPNPTPGQVFAPVAGLCPCTSPKVKTADRNFSYLLFCIGLKRQTINNCMLFYRDLRSNKFK